MANTLSAISGKWVGTLYDQGKSSTFLDGRSSKLSSAMRHTELHFQKVEWNYADKETHETMGFLEGYVTLYGSEGEPYDGYIELARA